ncbi:(Fe-S)-binding protein [Niallia endozanthoxylica]|uniref:4Fe-4S dicluster domain-containing protein n=1 Tax=Niallia endozanthoxylica TaxID=2036016 RepID=A0A5J5H9M6_9BACI|nr:(Fe-S)-binding protein [Niallia endozanthoxylica]KAA9016997.1 4Fe-4S dicluster domain-containing protein [Niallia endozanthoxylica]
MQTVQRDTFWMISFDYKIAMYVFGAIAIAIFVYGFYRRFRLWRKGVKEKVSWNDVKTNFQFFYKTAVEQKKIKRDRLFGFMHRFTSYGFVILFIGTVLVVVDYDFKIPLLQGNFYLIYELVLDVFGVLFLIGLLLAMVVRARKSRSRLRNRIADQAFLLLLFLIGIGGYIIEGIRLSETQISHAVWSPVGYGLAGLFQGNPLFGAEAYPIWWLSHALLAFMLIAIIPYTKLFHFLTAPINILFQPVKRTGKVGTPYNLEEMTEEERYESMRIQGVNKVTDFTGWQLLSTDACTECGRCDSQCPAHNSGKPLAPRSIVMKIRDNMHENQEISSFISPEELQSCTTCGACVEACPVSINHIDLILSMRRGLIQNQVMEEEAEKTLVKLEEQHNIFGKPWSDREDWSKGLNVPVLESKKKKTEKKKEGA